MDVFSLNAIILICTACVLICALILGLAHYLCFGRLLAEQLDYKKSKHPSRIIAAPAELEPIDLHANA